MRVTTYEGAGAFLDGAQRFLETEEAVNSLPLGAALRLARAPEAAKTPPFFATLEDGDGLRCAAVIEPPHSLLLYTIVPDTTSVCQALAEQLSGAGLPVPGVLAPSALAAQFAATWTALTGHSHVEKGRMTAYEVRRVLPPPAPGGHVRIATKDDLDLVVEWTLGFNRDIHEPLTEEEVQERVATALPAGDICVWENGGPVSMAKRVRPTRNGTCVSGVYTPPELRGKGYAAACVAALSQSLLDAGNEFCMLFADTANPTSNGIYQRIGYRPLQEFTHYKFDVPPA